MSEAYCISLEDVKEAAARIDGVAHRTPVLTSRSFDCHGKHFFFKAEALQRTGSFKFRGALNATKCEIATNTTASPLQVVTHSSGNHAQAVAMAAKLAATPERPVRATIVMPKNAPAIKQAATRGSGATVVLCESTNEARAEAADRIMKETGASFIHPSEDPRVIAGQGTCALELLQQLKELRDDSEFQLDAVIIPVGGGGLAAGNAVALRGLLGDKVKVRMLRVKNSVR